MFTDLHDGELIHGENFSLFAAMSALEVLKLHQFSYIVLLVLRFLIVIVQSKMHGFCILHTLLRLKSPLVDNLTPKTQKKRICM